MGRRCVRSNRCMAYWALIPAGYQVVAILAAVVFLLRKRAPAPAHWPPVSVLKPTTKGQLPPGEALDSNANQDYPVHEVVADESAGFATPNRKVGKLMSLVVGSRHNLLVVNDADIRVPRDYLQDVIATLEQRGVGLVTCLFRARGDRLASRFEALGVVCDFMPSVLVARLVGIREFAMGATLAFRRQDLDRIGGFRAIAPYIADDYQLAKKISDLGSKVELAKVVVETDLHGGWRQVLRHQTRWARTIRCSRPGAYAGVPVAQAGAWILAALLAGEYSVAAGLYILRVLMALAGGVGVLKSSLAAAYCWAAPIWDLFAFGVWISGWTGNTVEWQGRVLRLSQKGEIIG